MENQVLHLPINWLQFWIQAGIYLIMGIGAVVTVTWGVSEKIASWKKELEKAVQELDKKFEKDLATAIDNGDKKRARIYERFDEYKNFVEGQFVRKEMCVVVHNSSAQELGKINGRMDSFEGQLRGLNDKLDDLKTLILQKETK